MGEDPVMKAHEFGERFEKDVFPHVKKFLDENRPFVDAVTKTPERADAEHIGLLILLKTMAEHDRHADAYERAEDRIERRDRLYWMAVKKFQIMQALRDILKYHLNKGTPYTVDESWAKTVIDRFNALEKEYKPHYVRWLGFVVTPEERKRIKYVEDTLSKFPEL